MDQIGEKEAPVKAEGGGDKKVIQFLSEATITDFPELDFFGYLKTEKGSGGQNVLQKSVYLMPFRLKHLKVIWIS